jgi:hypothetical protein
LPRLAAGPAFGTRVACLSIRISIADGQDRA